MMNKKVQAAVNGQIQIEQYSSYLYLAMSAYCESKNLKGFAHWLKIQSQEEQTHAMKLYQHVLDRGGKIELKEIAAPGTEFGAPLELFEKVLAHEIEITGKVNALYEIALKEKDYPLQLLLHWFIEEQVEEEAAASEVLERLRLIGDKGGSIIYIDKEMGKRSA
jgi:ferritin